MAMRWSLNPPLLGLFAGIFIVFAEKESLCGKATKNKTSLLTAHRQPLKDLYETRNLHPFKTWQLQFPTYSKVASSVRSHNTYISLMNICKTVFEPCNNLHDAYKDLYKACKNLHEVLPKTYTRPKVWILSKIYWLRVV